MACPCRSPRAGRCRVILGPEARAVKAPTRARALPVVAILGPVYSSSSTVANMTVVQQAGIPQVTGSEAAITTQNGNPFIFRTSFGQDVGMAKMVKWLLEDLMAERSA